MARKKVSESMGLSAPERQDQLLAYVLKKGRASVPEIASEFSTSPATVRRDLNDLVAEGKVQRVHGGVLALRNIPPEPPVVQRASEMRAEKLRIAQAVAQMIRPGETVFLGSGTTLQEVARQIAGIPNLTVITNSLPVMQILVNVPEMTLICLGGVVRATEMSMIGHITECSLRELRADKVVIGIRSVHPQHGLTNDYLPETMTDRAILKIGTQVIVAADHTKCGRVSTALVTPIEEVNTLVTDSAVSGEFVEQMQTAGVNVILA